MSNKQLGFFEDNEYNTIVSGSERLTCARRLALEALESGDWVNPHELADDLGITPGGLTSRFRELRQEKYGGYAIEKKYAGNRTYVYRLVS